MVSFFKENIIFKIKKINNNKFFTKMKLSLAKLPKTIIDIQSRIHYY